MLKKTNIYFFKSNVLNKNDFMTSRHFHNKLKLNKIFCLDLLA